MKTILAMGQSNAIGNNVGGIFPACSAVTVWNSKNNINTLGSPGTAFVPANIAADPFVNGNNNMFYHAARYLSDILREDVRLILVAKSSTAIAAWAKSGGAMYARMKAVLAAAGVTSVDAFCWHQGESDEPVASAYAGAFTALLSDLEADGYIAADTPVVIGEIAPHYIAMNPVLAGLATGRVSIASLRTLLIQSSDAMHFAGPALVQGGWQYAKKLRDAFLGASLDPPSNSVSASAYAATSMPNLTNTKILVTPVGGEGSWIANGAFVAPEAGLYRFHAEGFSGGGRTRLMLLDASAGEIATLAYDAQEDKGSIIVGFADVDLAAGDAIYLGLKHQYGSTINQTAELMAMYNKLSVQRLKLG